MGVYESRWHRGLYYTFVLDSIFVLSGTFLCAERRMNMIYPSLEEAKKLTVGSKCKRLPVKMELNARSEERRVGKEC